MATIVTIEYKPLERDSLHSEVECTYSIVVGNDGRRYLQLDTYGSKKRQLKGKKSQSIRFAPEAIEGLKRIMRENGL